MTTKRPELKRIAGLKRLMAGAGIDALLITKRENVRYLTGFTGSAGSVLVASGKPCLITDFRYAIQARKRGRRGLRPDPEEGPSLPHCVRQPNTRKWTPSGSMRRHSRSRA